MKYLVVGSREFYDYDKVCRVLDCIIKKDGEIISGHARGADTLAERYALEHNIKTKIFPADWNRYGKRAGILRNLEMLDYIENSKEESICIAFWDLSSSGTEFTVKNSEKRGIRTIIIAI